MISNGYITTVKHRSVIVYYHIRPNMYAVTTNTGLDIIKIEHINQEFSPILMFMELIERYMLHDSPGSMQN